MGAPTTGGLTCIGCIICKNNRTNQFLDIENLEIDAPHVGIKSNYYRNNEYPHFGVAARNGRWKKNGFRRELKFNILKHVITHLYKHIGEEIVW